MATKAIARRRTVFASRPRARRAAKARIPLAIVGSFVPLTMFALDGYKTSGFEEAAHRVTMRLTGYNMRAGNWYGSELIRGWTPILAGMVAHKLANKFGLNRAIRKAIPFVEI